MAKSKQLKVKDKYILEFLGVFFIFFFIFMFFWHGAYVGWEISAYKDARHYLSYIFNLEGLTPSSGQASFSHTLLYFPFILIEIIILKNKFFETTAFVPLFYLCISAFILFRILKNILVKKTTSLLFTVLICFTSIFFPMMNLQMEYPALLYSLMLVFFMSKQTLTKNDHFFIFIFSVLLILSRTFGLIFILAPLAFYYSRYGFLNIYNKIFNKKTYLLIVLFISIISIFYLFYKGYLDRFSNEILESLNKRSPLEGFYGSLFSVGKGILIYNPFLFITLFLWRRFHKDYRDISFFILFLALPIFILNSISPAWSDERWCIRGAGIYAVLLHLPMIYILQSPELRKGYFKKSFLVLMLLVSFYVQLLGTLYPYYTQRILLYGSQHNLDSLERMRYIPNLSPMAIHHHLFKSYLSSIFNGYSIDWKYAEYSWYRFPKTDRETLIWFTIKMDEIHTPQSYFNFYKH